MENGEIYRNDVGNRGRMQFQFMFRLWVPSASRLYYNLHDLCMTSKNFTGSVTRFILILPI